MIDVNEIRKDFPVYQNHSNLIYLDSAASALKVKDAIDQVEYYHKVLGVNAHRGAYHLAFETTELYEAARTTVARFINADEDEVVFTRGTTTSLNMVASAFRDRLKEGDEIITSELEHHSSLLPWMMTAKKTKARLVYVPLTSEGRITASAFQSVLSDKTKVVALTHISNVMGYRTPIEEIVKIARTKDVVIILDAAQSAPHMRLDAKALDVDFLAFSGHKMFGPTGVGVLYGKKHWLSQIEPFEYGGEMIDEVYRDEATFKPSPMRFEAGTPNIAGVIGFAAAIRYLERVGMDQINAHVALLTRYTLDKLSQVEGVTIYNPKDTHSIITFNIKDVHPHDASTMLDQHHIGIRSGHHCAHLVARFLNTPATIRASFHIYNDLKDCDALVEGVIKTRDFFQSF